MAHLIFIATFLTAIIILGVSITQLLIVATAGAHTGQRKPDYTGPLCSILLALAMLAACAFVFARALAAY